jgi:hypothetical protein
MEQATYETPVFEEPQFDEPAPRHPIAIMEMPDNPADDVQAHILETYKGQAEALIPTDEYTLKSCAEFIEQCKLAAKRVEEKRTAQVDPLNKQVKAINEVLIPVRDAFKTLAATVAKKASDFIEDQRLAAQREQQRLIAEANKKKLEEERQAEEARKAAEAARSQGDESTAVEMESKADEAAMAAALTAPLTVQQPARSVDLGGGSTLSFGNQKPDWTLAGWDKKKPLPVIDQGKPDPRIASLVGDLRKLPEGIQWLLRFCEINPVLLNKACANEQFPAPFAMTKKAGASSLRGK